MYDIEIEKAVLFYMIFENQDFDILESDFADSKNRRIVAAIKELKAAGQDVSMISVTEKFQTNKAQVRKYLAELGEYVYGTSGNAMYNKLIDYSKKRQVCEMIEKIKKNMMGNADNLIEKMINELNRIGKRNERQITFSDQVIETMNEIENNYKQRSDYSLYTGLVNLDKILLGLHRKELTIIGARPRSWKDDFGITNF